MRTSRQIRYLTLDKPPEERKLDAVALAFFHEW